MDTELEELETQMHDQAETDIAKHLNRAQRRALMKKTSKRNRQQAQQLNEDLKKLDYIYLIEQLRELNNKEKNNNEGTNEDN